MKLPFSNVLAPVIKPYFGKSRIFCNNPTFSISIPYTYFYGLVGVLLNANHLRKHFGETPNENNELGNVDFMVIHDLKIIATSIGIVQYACLLVGCATENPALFLPHLFGQLITVLIKLFNILVLLAHINIKSYKTIWEKVPSILLLAFNWCQEFCVFRKYLCICDL